MEALSDILQPYKELVGKVAAIVTIGHVFSGTFVCYDIYKKGSSRSVPITPFIGGLVMNLLNLKYGYILRNDTMIQVNLAGIAINILYVMVYFHYSQEKVKVWAQIGLAGSFAGALIGYAQIEDPKLVEYRFGMIVTAYMFYLIASPLFDLRRIVKKKSTEGMPFPIILSATVVTFMWLLYGIILKNAFLVIQNLVAVLLCGSQLVLFYVYPSKPSGKEKAKVKKTD